MKAMSQTGAEDIQKKVGGKQWVETLDIDLGSDIDPYDDDSRLLPTLEWHNGSWHCLVANADAECHLDYGSAIWCYTAVPYQRDDVAENNGASGSVVTSIKLGDTAGLVACFMDRTDGMVGKNVKLSLHWVEFTATSPSVYISISTPEITYEFVVKETTHDGTWAKISLATALPLERQWPPRKTSKAKCRWVFKGCECQYSGNAATCARTIAACRALGNITHFGAFPGCGVGGLAQ